MSTLPPDPYAALGVSKTADSATIKSAYRKLVLKCHPDKVTDESLKAQKREEFDKIQSAYEIIGDDNKRQDYEAELKLESLRKEKLARSSSDPRVEIRTAQYDIRTAAPGGASFRERGPPRYEDRKSSRYDYDRYDEDRSSSRKFDTYDSYPKRSSPRTVRTEKETPVRVKVSSDRSRSDYKKTRDQAERRERSGKFVYVDDDDSSDARDRYEAAYKRRSEEAAREEKARHEAEYKRRSEEARYEARKHYEAEEAKRLAADARRRAEERRSAEESRRHREHRDERERKLSDQESRLKDYMHQAKAAHADSRPSVTRTSSSRDVRPEAYNDYDRSARRSEAARRSAARPKDRRGTIPEIVEWSEEEERQIPSFKQTTSSPAEIHVPRAGPQRAYTDSHNREQRHSETTSAPVFRRSETMPYPASSTRRHEAPRSSTLRSSETVQPHDSGYSSPSTPEVVYPTIPSTSKKVYHYPSASGGVKIVADDHASSHRTILREPERHRTRSPSPLGRPPIGSNRVVQPSSSSRYPPTAPAPPPTSTTIPPPLNRSATVNVSPSHADDRGRKLFGEIGSEYSKRENARRQTSFSPERVSYTKRYGPDDIRWSSSRHGHDPALERPAMRKQYTVY